MRRIRPRYWQASWPEKQRILGEFCANCGYHRKDAIRLLNGSPPSAKPLLRRRRGMTYGLRVIAILKAVWEAADYPWSVRLKALLPEWMPWIRRRFRLPPGVERQLLQISARSIDYRLRSEKRKLRRRLYGRTKPGSLLKHHIPLKTDHWDVKVPGFTEIDLVSHSHLWRYCQGRAIQFTRGRPYKKDDNAHIEQKNWTHVRRILGYVRYDTEAAREAINDLYRNELRLFQNLFLPSVKLEKKERIGSRLRRRYEAPQTPFQRVAASPAADPEGVTDRKDRRGRAKAAVGKTARRPSHRRRRRCGPPRRTHSRQSSRLKKTSGSLLWK
ncbi:MAG TPA: hypothetical protein VMX16_16550 [Terriglobia bacterium]|nr:hypothetical protein [Terriglobia bacterium]